MKEFFTDLYESLPFQWAGRCETYLFHLASKQFNGYTGGQWVTGAVGDSEVIFAFPDTDEMIRVRSAENYCDVTTNAKTAGLALTAIVLNRMGWTARDQNNGAVCQFMGGKWEKLHGAVLSLTDERAEELGIDLAAYFEIVD